MKILLLGANGQVGTECRRSLATLGELIAATREGRLADGSPCEIADLDAPESLTELVARVAPDVVVNAAAYTAVDRAESERDAAWRINAAAPATLVAACAERDALLVHYSTDYVFDGSANRPYREDDPTAPLGVYGESKLAGEQAIRASGCRHVILRTAWVYSSHGRNFLLTMLRLGLERGRVGVVADQFGAPTSAGLIADVTRRVLADEAVRSGTWHLTASGETSWYGFASEIFRIGLAKGLIDAAVDAMPITTADYPTPARRPAYSCLDTTKLRADFGITVPAWQRDLDEVLGTMAALN
jgi:dTDP-4-dehydrorhamnose reductase